ncbi:MAG: glycosyl hydrolase 115 family protein [Prolixibacteraceae bacterium]
MKKWINLRSLLQISFLGLLAFGMICCNRSKETSTEVAKQNASKMNYVSFDKGSNRFTLAEDGQVAPIVADALDYPGVFRILNYFKEDIKNIASVEPKLILGQLPHSKNIILVGTLGKNKWIDQLVARQKIDVSKLEGKWETSLIQVVDKPFEGIEQALVIVGSDKRGTFYGIFDVSRKMGVSPWYWWADVPILKHDGIYVKNGQYNLGEPKVKYRGIFLNDEEPALGRWAVENYGGFNHLFYEKVFELMLRLKGNYIWPAMWWASFNADDPMNTLLADEMGIVMGTSHHEPMDRAHAEWKHNPKGEWNYATNDKVLQQFWREGIERMGDREVIINMGMRGDGDMAMSASTNIALLERIVHDQREIIEEVTGKPADQTPQMWALYKEVQDYYDKGMRVPDDVTLLLCDDNWGNIRKLPKPGTPERSGGYGIYYHFDYVGGPRNYKWVNTSPIPRIWEQMNLAYEHGVDRLWLVNVGDLKPMEYPISFWLDYAWNPELIQANDLQTYALNWSEEQFGKQHAEDIAELLTQYTKFNGRRKPELLAPNTYSLTDYEEANTVIADYNALVKKAVKIGKDLPDEYHDAYYQLILHPVRACANLNELYELVAKNRLYAKQGRAATNDLAVQAEELYKKDKEFTEYYHTKVANGKWNNMMNQVHIGYTYWQQPNESVMPEVETVESKRIADMGIAVSGSSQWVPGDLADAALPTMYPFDNVNYYIDVFNRGKQTFSFKAISGVDWLKVSPKNGKVDKETRLTVKVDWKNAPEGENVVLITITGPENKNQVVKATVVNFSSKAKSKMKGYIETNGYVSIEAEHFARNVAGIDATWELIPGLGRTLSAMHPVPVNSLRHKPGMDSPVLEYDVCLHSTGEVNLKLHLSPTLNIYNDEGLELAVSIDDEQAQIINIHDGFEFREWEEAVRNNAIFANAKLFIKEPGNHTLKIWMVDPGIVLQKLVLETAAPRYSYLGPPESEYKN